jgi:DDE superfamily endonuclease
MTKRLIDYWVMAPENDAEFVACMEDVLETYARPYHPERPVLCMDEQPVQLLKETKTPMAATRHHPKRVDYEYERNGTASIFMFAAPLSGFRQTTTRPQRTKTDWAQEGAALLDTRDADCEKVTLVLDHLNTHTQGAFYEAFEPAVARAYVKRIAFMSTPKHGSWLNVAACERSAMTRQCLTSRRIGEISELSEEIAAWSAHTNEQQRGVDWQFQIDEARTKLKRLYPKIKTG